MRDRLIEIVNNTLKECLKHMEENSLPTIATEFIVDKMMKKGVIATPCVAMVEQFLKDGELDKRITAHNGKYAVVYIDKSKWNCPLIDITEQHYNADKANERIEALKGGILE